MPPQQAMPGDFVIRPPTTTGDDAKPSGSLLRDVRRVLALMQDERTLAAYDLYNSVRTRLEQWKNRQPRKLAFRLSDKRHQEIHTEDHEYGAANDLLTSKKAEFDKLEVSVNKHGIYLSLLDSKPLSFYRNGQTSSEEPSRHWKSMTTGFYLRHTLASLHTIDEKKTTH
jgi:hypothetical protein